MNDNIVFLPVGDFDAAKSRGWNGEGWYFWDEAGVYCYGPYHTVQIAQEKLNEYTIELMNSYKVIPASEDSKNNFAKKLAEHVKYTKECQEWYKNLPEKEANYVDFLVKQACNTAYVEGYNDSI